MQDFSGKVAVVTGGGSGMGRDLARKLAADGCHVAICDLDEASMAGTIELCAKEAPPGTRLTAHRCDVSSEADVVALRDAVADQHDTDHIHLLFNNAAIAGAGSLFEDGRERFDRVFDVCWLGVYLPTRVFLPMLVAAPEARLVNTSSALAFWAWTGTTSVVAYSAAKSAVRGLTEALHMDLKKHAPHVLPVLVLPGAVGTNVTVNSSKVLGLDIDLDLVERQSERYRQHAPTSSEEAADIILDGIRRGDWRILVGRDAEALDELVRADPDAAYEADFLTRVTDPSVIERLSVWVPAAELSQRALS